MSDGRRSFWSSVPGLVTGVAGLLTGIVGLGTLAAQQGIIGKDADSTTTSVTSAATEAGTFSVDPPRLEFRATDPREKVVTVRNTSGAAALTMSQPDVTGDTDRFSATFGTCSNAPLAPNLSCTVKVTFRPGNGLEQYRATLQIRAAGAPRGAEVALSSGLL